MGADFAGAGAAVAGSTPRALDTARTLARLLGMQAVEIEDADRGAYHAAASIASNFLVTLEDAAERLLATTGAPRSILVPLVRAAVENWATLGGRDALTGPIARGDEATVRRQRAAVADRTPEILELFDAMVARTRASPPAENVVVSVEPSVRPWWRRTCRPGGAMPRCWAPSRRRAR